MKVSLGNIIEVLQSGGDLISRGSFVETGTGGMAGSKVFMETGRERQPQSDATSGSLQESPWSPLESSSTYQAQLVSSFSL